MGRSPRHARGRLAGGDFDYQVIAMLAAVLVDGAHRDAMGAGTEIGGEPRDPDVRARLGLDPRLLGRLVTGEHFLHEWIGPHVAYHRDRRADADTVLDLGTRAAVEHVDDDVGRKHVVAGDRRAEQLAHARLAIKLAVGAV